MILFKKRIKKTTASSGYQTLNATHTYSSSDITLPKGYYKIIGFMRGDFQALAVAILDIHIAFN